VAASTAEPVSRRVGRAAPAARDRSPVKLVSSSWRLRSPRTPLAGHASRRPHAKARISASPPGPRALLVGSAYFITCDRSECPISSASSLTCPGFSCRYQVPNVRLRSWGFMSTFFTASPGDTGPSPRRYEARRAAKRL
jgi:hypothetical protein